MGKYNVGENGDSSSSESNSRTVNQVVPNANTNKLIELAEMNHKDSQEALVLINNFNKLSLYSKDIITKFIISPDGCKNNAFHVAANRGNVLFFKLVFEKLLKDHAPTIFEALIKEDMYGHQPIHIASYYGDIKIIELIMQYGIISDDAIKKAFYIANIFNHNNVAEYLDNPYRHNHMDPNTSKLPKGTTQEIYQSRTCAKYNKRKQKQDPKTQTRKRCKTAPCKNLR